MGLDSRICITTLMNGWNSVRIRTDLVINTFYISIGPWHFLHLLFILMEQDKSRSKWELFSDVFREASVLLWVFGVLLDHEHADLQHGIVIGVGGVVLFALGLIFEARRDIGNKKGN